MMDHLKRYAAHTYLVPLTGQRGYTLAEITAKAQHSGLPAEPRATVPQALRAAFNRAKSDDVILATGSHYLVQEVLKSEDLS